MKSRRLLWVRRFCQVFFFCLFVYLLVHTKLPQDIYLDYSPTFGHVQDLRLAGPLTFFFKLDPLVWLSSAISARQWLSGFAWAMGLLVSTVLLGRFFCSFVCPLGTLHHLVGSIRPVKKARALKVANQTGNQRRIKYLFLIAFLTAALMGVNYSGLMDPISLLFRSLATSILPAVGIGLRQFFEYLSNSNIKVFNFLGYGLESLVAPVFGYENKVFQAGWLIGALVLGILYLNRFSPRFWCRFLCPLGALLGLFSRFSIFTLKKDRKKCTHCSACVRKCQGGASPEPDTSWQKSECLLCLNCSTTCPEEALSFGIRQIGSKTPATDIGRRAVMGGLVAGVSLPLLGKLGGQDAKNNAPALIRPPGSLSEPEFLDRCQRCGMCMKVCPTNVINPALTEAGLAGFWTPILIMTQGYCEYTCTLCAGVCPTGAIGELTATVKIEKPVRIGSAYLDRGRCLPWSGNEPCIVCEEHCPTSPKAIYFKKGVITRPDGQTIDVQLPFVNLNRCVGCGICSYKCPVKGKPAIRTISAGESRSLENQILL